VPRRSVGFQVQFDRTCDIARGAPA